MILIEKKLYDSAQNSKNNRIITDSINNDSIGNSKFAKKKKSIYFPNLFFRKYIFLIVL